MARGLYTIYTNCTDPARHEEYNRWYSHTHLTDLSGAQGLVRGRRYTAAHPEAATAQYLTLYEFESDDLRASARDLTHIARGTIEAGRHIECLTLVSDDLFAQIDESPFQPLERVEYPPYPPPEDRPDPASMNPLATTLDRAVNAIMTNCSDLARDEEFNRWYKHVHVPDLRPSVGMVKATRYRNALPHRGPAGYLALYEFETDDLEASFRDMGQRALDARASGRRIECLEAVRTDHYLEIDAAAYQPLEVLDYPRDWHF